MGQQQLLLIVLSAIIVGISIVVGINMVTTGAGQANFDAVMQDVMSIGESARDYYRRPALAGGGGNSFANLTTTNMDSVLGWPPENANGSYTVESAVQTNAVFQGIGKEDVNGDGTNLTIQITVYRDSLTTTIVNR